VGPACGWLVSRPGQSGCAALVGRDGLGERGILARADAGGPSLPWRVSAWLAGPAASPLLAAVAAVTAIGWSGAAVVLAAAAAAGAHPILPGAAVDASGFVLAVADIVAGIGARARRAELARPSGAAEATRRAAGRGRQGSSGPPVALQAVWRVTRPVAWRHRRVFATLPRPVTWFFAVAIWPTVGAYPWVTFEVVSHGSWWADLGTTAAGQQLAALVWMTHLLAWSGAACRRLDRTRAAARMMRAGSVSRR
jgi:hypothetical protein